MEISYITPEVNMGEGEANRDLSLGYNNPVPQPCEA